MLKTWIQTRNRMVAIVHDICMIPLAWFCAFWLRYNLEWISKEELAYALAMLPTLMIVQMAA